MRKPVSRLPAIGPTIQAKPAWCPTCDGRRIVKNGLRKNSKRHIQIYWCKDCARHFSFLAGLKGVKYPPRVIARALCLYNLGLSQEQTARRIGAEFRVAVPRRTISEWILGYQPITTFHRLRAAAVGEFGQSMLKERTLEHRQNYQYKVHLAKLTLTAKTISTDIAAKVKNYLFSIFEGFPDALFQDEPATNLDEKNLTTVERPASPPVVMRSSTSDFETLPLSRISKQNLANDLAAMGLLLARKNKDRHPSIQDFMLANDSCTIACEVPVYLTSDEVAYYRSKGFFLPLPELSKPITGHIDIVQVRNGLIHLLDYKPKAREIDAVNQLVIYALAFASRARLPVKAFKCAWFDEKDFFEFFPLQAVRARTSHANA
jgi:transposase-like protein